jgi:AcrR family transcriptional regulator
MGGEVSRMSRAESQQQTRTALLRAARQEFSQRGFLAASLERIATAAGYTRGAVYKNFTDKYDLFHAVLTDWTTRQTGTLADDLAAAPDGTPQLDALQKWFENFLVPQALAAAYTEFSAAAATHPEARVKLVQHQQSVLIAVTAMIENYCARASIRLPIPAAHFAAMVAALATGLANQRKLDPAAVPADLYSDALTYLWNGMLAGEPRPQQEQPT